MKEKISNQDRTEHPLAYICSPLRPVSPDVSAHPDELKCNSVMDTQHTVSGGYRCKDSGFRDICSPCGTQGYG